MEYLLAQDLPFLATVEETHGVIVVVHIETPTSGGRMVGAGHGTLH
jgi:hypothetical protein